MTKENSSLKIWLIAIVVLISLFAIWCFFPLFFQWLIVGQFKIDPKSYGETFGAVGDTYGSLNTFVSSVALCAVAFSTWVQVTSLRETREANERQITLAENSHQDQLKETKYSIFSNMFYALLNEKQERNKSIFFIKNNEKKGLNEIFGIINCKLFKLLENEWNDVNNIDVYKLRMTFDETLREYNSFDQAPDIYTYFLVYGDILNLIKQSDIDEKDKDFFKNVLKNSMMLSEQITLLWLSAFTPELKNFLKDSKLFDYFYSENLHSFVFKFHQKSHFNHYKFNEVWPKNE